MRKVSYRVVTETGNEFITTSYKEATNGENIIKETILTEVDETTDEQKRRMAFNAERAWIRRMAEGI